MINEFYFQFNVTDEQLEYSLKLVDYSILNHTVKDIFQNDPGGKDRQKEYRLTGTLGEVIFADAYNLERPKRSFGAIDGQDFGHDFSVNLNGHDFSFDIKSMKRKNNIFRENYVLNLPCYQMKKNLLTDYYYCISLHELSDNSYVASFIGFVSKKDIVAGKIGVLYKAGTKRLKDDGAFFIFQRDTYEIDFKDITTPILNEKIKISNGFEIKKLLPPFHK